MNVARRPQRRTESAPRLTTPARRTRAPRLSPAAREKLIVEGAIEYFAAQGLAADTRGLAEYLGIGQALVFRYFPSKEALIKRVFQEVIFDRWDPEKWKAILARREVPIETRLNDLYANIAEGAIDYCWIRILMFSGLKDQNIEWQQFVIDNLTMPVCAALRHEYGFPNLETRRATQLELEVVGLIGASISSYAIKKHIYGFSVPEQLHEIFAAEIKIFLSGIRGVMAEAVASGG